MPKQIYLFSTSLHPDAISINSLDITFYKPDIDFSNYDYFIITSKQISEALKQYDSSQYEDKQALCVSKQTALSYEKISGKVLDVGDGYGDSLVDKIEAYPKEIKWLYLRAKVVASDFVRVASKKGYKIDEVIMYESKCSEDMKDVFVEDDAVLIFTSPSSVKCFLKNKNIYNTHKVIVIGNTTASALPKGVNYMVSKETNVESCFKLI